MKILALKFADGSVTMTEAPSPVLAPGFVRVHTQFSAVSPGTEGGKITTGKMSLLGKAKSRPDQVKKVVDMARAIGVRGALQKVRAKLEGAEPLGYSLSGVVAEVGEGVTKVRIGDLVACGGGGYANHADEVVVPQNLVAKVPNGVPADAAAVTTLGAIALQGVRLANPSMGEAAVVIGLGVVGLLASQILRCSGCRVLGVDVSAAALGLALKTKSVDEGALTGRDSVEAQIDDFTRGRGADIVLICAATSSDDPVQLAGRIARKRARVIVVGAVGMNLPRENYYEKEISFSVSCSYGPGRYDPSYEESGLDYPFGLVRWTEGRNLEAFLDMVGSGQLRPLELITHRFAFDDAPQAYDLVAERTQPYAGILLEYPAAAPARKSTVKLQSAPSNDGGTRGIGCIGAGSYAQSFLLPPLRKLSGIRFTDIFTRTGLSAVDTGRRFGFERAVDSAEAVLEAVDTNAVVIATRHDQHGPLVLKALAQGKHVFVEKPLCITREELGSIAACAGDLARAGRLPIVQTGYNRRFSPGIRRIREHFGSNPGPMVMMYRVNAGAIPPEHWVQDPIVGGGRIVGEVCHFVDTLQFLTGADPIAVSARCIVAGGDVQMPEDSVLITLDFADGSIGTIAYCARGASSLPKEYLEVHAARRSAILDNFASVSLFGPRGHKRIRCSGKGQAEELTAFVNAVRGAGPAMSMASQLATTLTTLCALESLRTGALVRIELESLSWTSEQG